MQNLASWKHDHTFGQDRAKSGESRTLAVVLITAVMMVVEIAAGITFGSMALLADGLHMGSHATALGIAVFAYVYARKFSADRRYSLGTGKVNSLAGFASAVLLAGFAFAMVAESVARLLEPVPIAFDKALLVAAAGLVVNGASAWILAATPHHHRHDHHPRHDRHDGYDGHRHDDHNLRAAYLHVLADALTSLLAIAALLAGKYAGASWLDPVMGIVGAALVARWSYGLLRDTGHVLLDRQAPEEVTEPLRKSLEAGSNDQVADLHVWSIGPDIRAAAITLVSDAPQPPDHYRAQIPAELAIVHATIEVHRCSPSPAIDGDRCAASGRAVPGV